MRVLIIGCGYVGLPLGIELVKQGYEVFGLRRSMINDAELKTAGITPLQSDITKPETLAALPRDFDWVVNCAASGGGDAADYRRLYLQGMRNVIEWLCPSSRPAKRDQSAQDIATEGQRRLTSAATLKKFIWTSSTGVYGQTDGSLVTEISPTEPATDTAKVLVETEKLLMDVARGGHCSVSAQNQGSDGSGFAEARELPSKPTFPAVILRVAGIYGPDRGYLLKQYLKNEARIEGKGGRIMNMIHRDDLIGAIIAALKSGKPGEVYNAVDDEPVSQRTFFEWLAGTLGKDLPPSVPEDLETSRKRGVTSKKVSNRKLKMELGYQFKYPNFRKGYTAELIRLDRAGHQAGEPGESIT